MKKTFAFLIFIIFTTTVYGYNITEVTENDTTEVVTLNKNGYANRFTNPRETVKDAEKALELALKLDYKSGIAESYRVRGIGEYYLNKPDSAYNSYAKAIEMFKKLNDERGVAKVNNNIGNLYQMVDYDKALDYFKKAEVVAEKYADKRLIASLQLNIGNVYNRKRSFTNALASYNRSYALFIQLKDSVNQIQCLENLGDIYYKLRDYKKAEQLLLDANKRAKAMDMNASIAAINMTLTDIYIAQSRFADAEKYIEEGIAYSESINNDKNNKNIYEYKHSIYELARKRKNYEKALAALEEIYQLDSTNHKAAIANRLSLLQNEQEQEMQKKETELNADKSRIKFWSVTLVAALLLVVVGLLITNVRRKAVTNLKLQVLNEEVSRQKDNLDRINHHLEEIIDERTKDLQAKNKKLSDYSSYLSHQIRGPIATLKGLINLENEGLVDEHECIDLMGKCISEIDEKIIEMSDMLQDPTQNQA
ncbi:tetratricopeptide repeat protein [Mucilaginibacter auburnensis]|uniref:Tetratricopeptide repeat protein n=1 Tax=Mucilaginibacter auburnensis TaxID=1457233 RepID=A0A2H9VVR2_9SPHI|nr:tetratricopeptide repeat protein [Mucilaginibacter auburnensis]PJJ84907.1 tetratricopeptide repeat protein [Mucilaginibacter auburnensis]